MNNELKIKAMALFNFLSMHHEKNKRIGELSVKGRFKCRGLMKF